MKNKRYIFNNLIIFLIYIIFFSGAAAWAEPRNIIFLIGDGMGYEEIKAASLYSTGEEGNLLFETFPYQGEITTYSSSSQVTDSAAAATAMATGVKVNNGVISMAIPGDGSELYSILEYFRDKGKSTGLVSTAYITHATPAAFGAHENNRNNYSEIANDYIQQTKPNILFGGGANGISINSTTAAGYTVITNSTEMRSLNTDDLKMVSGQFGNSHMPYEYDYSAGVNSGYDSYPHLSEMTQFALDVLDNDPEGFFLMIEGGRIDHAGHENNIERNIFETIEFNETVQTVYDWVQIHPNSLIIVTADHETGGLTVLENNGQGQFPTVDWATVNHTGVNVPIYAWGQNAYLVSGALDNTDLFEIATDYSVDGGGSGDGGCFIAVAAYGSFWEPHVMTLRQFRDSYLLSNKLGTKFIEVYYKYSPPMADYIAEHDSLRSITRIGLAPLVGFAWVTINYGMVTALIVLLSVLTIILVGTCLVFIKREAN